jgi:hypothetical protein
MAFEQPGQTKNRCRPEGRRPEGRSNSRYVRVHEPRRRRRRGFYIRHFVPHPLVITRGRPSDVLRRCAFVVHVEMRIALDGKTQGAAQFTDLAHADKRELLGPRLRSAVHASLRSGRAIHVSTFAGVQLTLGRRPAGPPKVGSKRLLPFYSGHPMPRPLHKGEPPARKPAAQCRQVTIRPWTRASSAQAEIVFSASKCLSHSTGRPSLPRTVASSASET